MRWGAPRPEINMQIPLYWFVDINLPLLDLPINKFNILRAWNLISFCHRAQYFHSFFLLLFLAHTCFLLACIVVLLPISNLDCIRVTYRIRSFFCITFIALHVNWFSATENDTIDGKGAPTHWHIECHFMACAACVWISWIESNNSSGTMR